MGNNFGLRLRVIKRWACVIALALLSACRTPIRDCPAFYHPDAALLLPGSVGSVYQYTDNENNIEKYTIEHIDVNEPYSVPYLLYGGRVNCDLTRKVKLISTDKSRGFEFAFRHNEDPRHPIQNHWFTLIITPFNAERDESFESQYFDFTFSASDSFKDEYYHYHPKKVINGTEYSEVYVKDSFGTTKVKPTPFLMNRIVLSKGHGLIQYRLVDNTEFNILPI